MDYLDKTKYRCWVNIFLVTLVIINGLLVNVFSFIMLIWLIMLIANNVGLLIDTNELVKLKNKLDK